MQNVAEILLTELPLVEISRVEFFKRDEITTDLICCEITVGDSHFLFHEDMTGWELLLEHLARLPGFTADWRDSVVLPPFAECRTVAFSR